jgi:polyphosphate glucokinase
MTQTSFPAQVVTLSIDIGGSGIKCALLNAAGEMISERQRIDTPYPCPPERLLTALNDLAGGYSGYHRVSVGFPGLIRNGQVKLIPSLTRAFKDGLTDPQLVEAWQNFELAKALNTAFKVPVRVANDADIQGSAVIKGAGLELVITLGTGCGSALFNDGTLLPHLELGHAPFRKGETFEEQLGNAARKEIGNDRWICRVNKAIPALEAFIFFDHLYLGGGNARHLAQVELGPKVTLVENTAGILGGIKIWEH